eukprot:11051210-Alexandrium_andersonii.AAC.1
MSASLVGSEMCIRDSHRVLHPHTPRSSPPPAARNRPSCAAPSAPSVAVSYTHLTLPTICSV